MPIPVSQHYPELLHYTTFAGLRGILSSGSMWATDAAFLNDSSEISHFFDERLRELIAEDARQYAIELARVPKHLVQMIKDGGFEQVMATEVEAWHSSLRDVTLAMNRPFVLSLSAPSDEKVRHSGLLSQWRGYGDDGGFAIVFDSQELESMLKDEAFAHNYMFVQMGDVYYHEIDPKIQPATSVITEYENIVHQAVCRAIRGGSLEENGRFYEAVTALSCLYKHWGFWEEREVRVVVVPASQDVVASGEPQALPQKEVLFRNRDGQELPYVELFSSVGLAGATAPLPIKRIIVGPHKNREAHAESVRQELDRAGYAVDVVHSKIPYIGR
jgi:hypothetical protein